MKKIIIIIAIAALLIGGVAGAAVLYDHLSEDYGADGGFVQFEPSGNGGLTQNKPEQATENNTEAAEIKETETGNAETKETEVKETDNSEIEDTEVKETDNAEIEDTEIEDTEIEDTEVKETETKEQVILFSAPDFTVLDYDGNQVKLSDFAGKPIVLNFWATWCYYCKIEMPDFNQAYKNFPDVQFLMVNATDGVSETVASAKKYVEAQGFEFEVLFDTKLEALNTYGVSGFPTTFFISADGSSIYYISGAINYETLVKGIELIK